MALCGAGAWVIAAALLAGATTPRGPAIGRPAADGSRAGAERLYRDGVRADGSPAVAVVLGDVETSGAQVSCAACHGRSGMGTAEGGEIVPPITGLALAGARGGARPRPAYDRESLARAIREGVDAGGNRLAPLMPRYALGDEDVEALVTYLENLSIRPAPGVEEGAIHLATVVTPDAPPAVRRATLDVLRAYVAAQNAAAARLRASHRRSLRSSVGRPEHVGDWVVHVWELRGPPARWSGQLEALQRARPVFAAVSGAGGAEWGPVHRFCEEQGMPCLLPNVDTPPDAGDDWYSLYYSRGAALEADVIAAHLSRSPGRHRVLQVYRAGGPGAAGARGLRRALAARAGDAVVRGVAVRSDDVSTAAIAARARAERATAIVLWLPPADLARLRTGAAWPQRTYVSSTLLGGELSAASGLSAREGFIAHPFSLPGEVRDRSRAASSWMASRGLQPVAGAEARVRDQTFVALELLSAGMMHLTKERRFSRDFLVEVLDHTSGRPREAAYYPEVSFGPGQRYVSKGCYLVPLPDREDEAERIVP
ncbi:MAG TPA: cytochrome c [Anaeromyxobacter sp.]|nr:cytochrome c [Anaeromyxobacter sp.]